MKSSVNCKSIKVKVFPRSGKSCVEGMRNGLLIVRLKSAPEKGKANKELLEVLAQHYFVHINDILVIHGHTSRIKLIKIECSTNREQASPDPVRS